MTMATTTVAAPAQAPATRIDYASILDQRTKMLILFGVLLSLFLAALDQTIVSTALPRIIADLQGIDLIAWVSTSYLLASTAMVPIYGKLSDIYGRKLVLLFGITVFLIGSVLCGLASTMIWLIIFRGIQGFGAAALTSTAFSIPADLFVPAERARYQGVFGAVFGLSSVIGPFVGGLLTDAISWHWVFFVNLPLGIIALAFIATKMPLMESGLRPKIDYLGAITLILTVVPLLLALTLDKSSFAWGSPLIVGLLVTSAIGLVVFLLAERRAASPILPLHLFRKRIFTIIIITSVTIGAIMFASIFFLSLYLTNVLGVSATEAGTTLIPLMLSLVAASFISAQIVQRLGRYKPVIIVGLGTIIVALWWLTTLTAETSIWMVRLRMMLLGLGLGPAMPTLNLALQNAVAWDEVGTVTASRQFFQQLGQVVGSTIFGVILTATLTASLTASLEPISAQLPAEQAAQLDPAQLRNGTMAGGEGATGEAVDPAAAIEERVQAGFAEQRDLLTRALRDQDAAATQALLANPQTPEQLRQALSQPSIPAAQREQILSGALSQLDTAEAAAHEQARSVGGEISAAVKRAFTESVTQIYRYAIGIAVLAFVLAWFIPEIPLRKTNRPAAPVMAE
jgi:EmrB/QacA subfamily drug resistance transporter